MNRPNRLGIDRIEKSFLLGMVIVPLLLVSIQPAAAKRPGERDNTNNRPPVSATSNAADDAGKRNSTINTPPPRQTPPNNASKPNQSFREGNSSGAIRNRDFTPPRRNDSPAPPTVLGPSSPEKNTNDANRCFAGEIRVAGHLLRLPKTIRLHRAQSLGLLRPKKKNTIDANENIRSRKFSPANTPQPTLVSPNQGLNSANDPKPLVQRTDRPTLSETRKRLDEKTNDRGNNPAANTTGDNILEKAALAAFRS